jgi:SAM-dependent methyltransferase
MNRLKRWLEFNYWYFKHPPWDTGISPPELYTFIESHPPGRALDLGCGTGTNVITLAKYGWQVIGVDFALTAIVAARRKARATNVMVDVRVGDVTRLDGVTGPFDLILDIGCYHGLPPSGQDIYARAVKRRLAPGGALLLYVQFKDDPSSQRSGVVESDLLRFRPELALRARTDGVDTARRRPSTWLTFTPQV